MEIRNSSCKLKQREREWSNVSNFVFCVSVFAFLLAAGCGAPGDPTPPAVPIPQAITDLSAQQAGDGVQLTFSLPTKSINGERLSQPSALEIVRGETKLDGSPDAKTFRVVHSIPGSLVVNYLVEGRIQFADVLSPEDSRARPGRGLSYLVRTRPAKNRVSSDSNVITLRIYPVPEHISAVETRVTETAIELNWSAPARTSAGEPLAALAGYRVYRGEIDPSSAEEASRDITQVKWKSRPALLASSDTNFYRDSVFEFEKAYVYMVRSVVRVEAGALESGDSSPAIVTARDIFPPAAPKELVAAILPGEAQGSAVVDLSWSLNLETDLAGYRVYRSEQQGAPGRLVTPALLPTPAYRDTSVEPGRRYWYTVTAVDRAGNESVPSEPAEADVAKPSP